MQAVLRGSAEPRSAAGAAAALARAEALGGQLPPLLVDAERVAATVTQGLHGRRRVGQGDSFWQFRPLLPGEGGVRIDWRRSARTDAAHFVRQTEWEAAQSVMLWHGAAPTMDWRSLAELPRKRERAQLLLLALASMLVRAGERVRLLGPEPIDATNLVGLGRIALTLGAPASGAGPELTPALTRVPRYCAVVLISDWLEPIETLRPSIAALAERHANGHVLQVLDPAEVELPYAGRLRFRGLGDGAVSTLVGKTEGIRGAYAGRLAEHQAALAGLCHGAGLTFSVHRTDHSAVSALLSLYSALAERTFAR